jgi:hypothetical protein
MGYDLFAGDVHPVMAVLEEGLFERLTLPSSACHF